MDWLIAQAQSASPIVAFSCVLAFGGGLKVIQILWRQLLFERVEHRKAEADFTSAAVRTAVAVEKLAASVERPRRKRPT